MNTVETVPPPRFPSVGDESLLAVRKAVREALAEHGRLGRPVVVGRDGDLVTIPIDENDDEIEAR